MSSVDKSSSSPAENPSLLTGRNWIERLLVSFIDNHTPKCREVVRLLSQSMEVSSQSRLGLEYGFITLFACGVSVTGSSSEDCGRSPLRYRSTLMDSVPRLSQIHRRNG